MNYRHIYHAGNFGDVLKHLVLVLCLNYLQRKDGGLCIVDAHGGAGLYDLNSPEAKKTGEAARGIGCLADAKDAPADLQMYLRLVENDLSSGCYPGSPLLIARHLRPQDRLVVNELHPDAFHALEDTVAHFANVRCLQMDAYQCIRAHVPPKERRGLVLIDSPFEKKEEFETLAKQMAEWKKRWATGVYAVWYPIKPHLPVAALKENARNLSLPRTWFAEIFVAQVDQDNALQGCGVMVFNTPYSVPERIEQTLLYLKKSMSLKSVHSQWISLDN